MISADELRDALNYCPETGTFTWKTKTGKKVVVGSVAGSVKRDGYTRICVNKQESLAHRLAWLYVHGEWPRHDIDHINGSRSDNRIANLRDVTRSVNLQNRQGPNPRNRTGLLGVSPNGSGFRSSVKVGNEQRHLGTYRTPEQAHAVYMAARRELYEGNTI